MQVRTWPRIDVLLRCLAKTWIFKEVPQVPGMGSGSMRLLERKQPCNQWEVISSFFLLFSLLPPNQHCYIKIIKTWDGTSQTSWSKPSHTWNKCHQHRDSLPGGHSMVLDSQRLHSGRPSVEVSKPSPPWKIHTLMLPIGSMDGIFNERE